MKGNDFIALPTNTYLIFMTQEQDFLKTCPFRAKPHKLFTSRQNKTVQFECKENWWIMVRFFWIIVMLAGSLTCYQLDKFKFLVNPFCKPKRIGPKVHTHSGWLQGTQENSDLTHKYFAFRGIPYAQPPLGELRFRNPVSHRGWSGTKIATKYGDSCLSEGVLGLFTGSSEDCLFLNVFSSRLQSKMPVMVFVHGGGWFFGDGNAFLFGPELLVREDVVIVTFNYRLSVFGFLSTGDKHAQGNYGLKDMVMALKWVKKNVRNFGGDPDNITIFGQSAGSASVHYLMMSKMSQGLFHKAIMMSGTAISNFASQTTPRKVALALGRKLKLNVNSTETLVGQLRLWNHKKFFDVTRGGLGVFPPVDHAIYDFGPTVEPRDSLEERFLTETPIKTMLRGNYRAVPLMIGVTSNEGLFVTSPLVLNFFYKEPALSYEFFPPKSYELHHASSEAKKVIVIFNELYFGNQTASKLRNDVWSKFFTDAEFKFMAQRVMKFLVKKSAQPIYSYEFVFDGSLSFYKRLVMQHRGKGACHCDDLNHLFTTKIPSFVAPNDPALRVRRRHIKMFTNFAKFG